MVMGYMTRRWDGTKEVNITQIASSIPATGNGNRQAGQAGRERLRLPPLAPATGLTPVPVLPNYSRGLAPARPAPRPLLPGIAISAYPASASIRAS